MAIEYGFGRNGGIYGRGSNGQTHFRYLFDNQRLKDELMIEDKPVEGDIVEEMKMHAGEFFSRYGSPNLVGFWSPEEPGEFQLRFIRNINGEKKLNHKVGRFYLKDMAEGKRTAYRGEIINYEMGHALNRAGVWFYGQENYKEPPAEKLMFRPLRRFRSRK